jgi:phosphoribosylanthranilate isomerase
MLVKICGITRPEDADAAVAAGAGAIGFIFWPQSPRFVDPYRARRIAAGLPPFVTAVGVFVNQPLAYVNGVASLVRLGVVQLHGDETPEFAAAVSRPVMKAVSFTIRSRAAVPGAPSTGPPRRIWRRSARLSWPAD